MTTSKHALVRNEANEPVCKCGYRPDVLDTGQPIGVLWKAKADILNHAANRNAARSRMPFTANHELKYPRAGVRQDNHGKWVLTFWDSPEIQHIEGDPIHNSRLDAFDLGHMVIGAHRQAGTNLNGYARR